MMPVNLAVGRHVNQRMRHGGTRRQTLNALRKHVHVAQQMVETDFRRQITVIKKHVNKLVGQVPLFNSIAIGIVIRPCILLVLFSIRRILSGRAVARHVFFFEQAIRLRRVNRVIAHVPPFFFADFSDAFRLRRRENDVFDSLLNQAVDRFFIDAGFREPNGFGGAPEAALEFAEAPDDLRDFVARVCQRNHHVIIHLRNRVAVSVMFLAALAIRFDDVLADFRRMFLHPREQRGADIKVDMRKIIF